MAIKKMLRRLFSLALLGAIIATLLPAVTVPASAAIGYTDGSVSLDDTNIGVTYSYYKLGNCSGKCEKQDGTTLYVSASGGTKYFTDNAGENTITIQNKSSEEATLSFDYECVISGGTITVDGTGRSGSGSFSKKLTADSSIKIVLKTEKGSDKTVSITLKNLLLVAEKRVNITFKTGDGGSYTVNGDAISSTSTIDGVTSTAYAVVATPASGNQFFGWYNETDNTYQSYDASAELRFDSNKTVKPVFISASLGIFSVGNKRFYDLNKADQDALSNGNKIVLIKSGTLPSGNYFISKSNTLLIPFDDFYTCYTTTPTVEYAAHVTPSPFKTLTMASGASITVKNGGTISVSSKLSANSAGSSSWNGTPSGPHGRISMQETSSITLESGAKLCTYGYIGGSGSVLAKSGSTVYECFQIRDWRGGMAMCGNLANAMSGTLNSVFTSNRIFPLSQYYIQNVEVPLTFESGATEIIWAGANIATTKTPLSTSATFIGTRGMFELEAGSTITKSYNGTTDRMVFDINGNANMRSFSLSFDVGIGEMTINTANFVLPITNNFTVNIHSGTTSLYQDLALLPGAEVNIDKSAAVDIPSGYNVYVYDRDQWTTDQNGVAINYTCAGQMNPVGYSTVNGTTAKRNAAGLVDAKMDVNGTLTVNGKIYTTKSGANITSSQGTGVVVFTSGAGTETTTHQVTQSGNDVTKADISITSAQLHNGDGSYTTTADAVSKVVYHYCSNCHKWYKVGNHHLVNLYVNDSETAFVKCTNDISVSFENIENPALNETTYEPAKTAAKESYDSDTKTLTVNGLDAETTTVHVYTARAEVVTVNNEGTSSSTAYSTIQKAIDKCTDGSYIRMITDSTEESLALTKNVCLDLAGKTVTLTKALSDSGKLYGMDSTATNYRTAPAGKLILPGGTVAQTAVMPGSGETYVKIVDGNTYSFHRCNLYINGYRFELNRGKNEGALIFQATLQGDDKVMAAAPKGGFVINDTAVDTDKDKNPVALTADGQFEGYWHTTSVKENLETPISAVAQVYFLLDTADPIESHMISLTFKKAMEKADELTDVDKEKINAFFDTPIFTASPA